MKILSIMFIMALFTMTASADVGCMMDLFNTAEDFLAQNNSVESAHMRDTMRANGQIGIEFDFSRIGVRFFDNIDNENTIEFRDEFRPGNRVLQVFSEEAYSYFDTLCGKTMPEYQNWNLKTVKLIKADISFVDAQNDGPVVYNVSLKLKATFVKNGTEKTVDFDGTVEENYFQPSSWNY